MRLALYLPNPRAGLPRAVLVVPRDLRSGAQPVSSLQVSPGRVQSPYVPRWWRHQPAGTQCLAFPERTPRAAASVPRAEILCPSRRPPPYCDSSPEPLRRQRPTGGKLAFPGC